MFVSHASVLAKKKFYPCTNLVKIIKLFYTTKNNLFTDHCRKSVMESQDSLSLRTQSRTKNLQMVEHKVIVPLVTMLFHSDGAKSLQGVG